jgi:hypothetical protein
MALPITKEKKELIIQLYQQGVSIRKIKEKLNSGSETILNTLRKENIVKNTYYKYSINHVYFKNIATDHQAYWLGFIAADGNVYKNYLQISLSKKDHEHLLKFQESVGSTHKIYSTLTVTNKKYKKAIPKEYSHFKAYSPNIVKDLIKLGITPCKTGNLDFDYIFNQIPKPYYKDFIRGYFDGDGAWNRNFVEDRLVFRIGGMGIKFMEKLQKEISVGAGLIPRKLGTDKCGNSGYYYFYWSRKQDLLKLYNYMYDKKTTFLQRKKNIVESFLQRKKLL